MHSLQIIPLGELLEGGVRTLLFVFRDSETEVQGPAYLDMVYMCSSWRVLCSVIDLLNSIAPPSRHAVWSEVCDKPNLTAQIVVRDPLQGMVELRNISHLLTLLQVLMRLRNGEISSKSATSHRSFFGIPSFLSLHGSYMSTCSK